MAKKKYETSKKQSKPSIKENPDFTQLIEDVKSYIEHVESNNIEPKDIQQYIFESACEAICGPNFFKWVGEKTK